MKANFLIILLLGTLVSSAQSIVKESLTLKSDILNKEMRYSIYLPEGYSDSSRKYPVLYLLHGYTYDETAWVQYGTIQEIVDKSIRENALSKMIIVMPDGGVTWFQNDLEGKVRYEDYFIEEFIPYIEKMYKVRSDKQFRSISGFSMGGWGALLLAMKHSEMFSSVAVLNAAIYTDKQLAEGTLDQQKFDSVFGDLYGKGLNGYARINDAYKRNAPLYLLTEKDKDTLKNLHYYVDCADDDFLIPGNMEFHLKMREMGIVHEFRVRDGSHTWTYWRNGMPEILKFIDTDFRKS